MSKVDDEVDHLTNILNRHGICEHCGNFYDHAFDEPIASCGCRQSEWYEYTPWMNAMLQIKNQKAELDFLRSRLGVKPLQDLHLDDVALVEFCGKMSDKLKKKREEGRGGWEDKNDPDMNGRLSLMLLQHVFKGDPVDVANLAMMISQRGEGIFQDDKPNFSGFTEAL